MKKTIPNLLTTGNLVGGILAIVLTLTGGIEYAPWCIFVSAIFDFLDGFVARLLKVQNELGKQLDSLADMVTFGVAPGIMMLTMIHINFQKNSIVSFVNGNLLRTISKDYSQVQPWQEYLMYIALLIPIFALFRLAKFNLDTRQTSSFIGLPTPAMTLFFAVIPLLVINGYESEVDWKIKMASFLINPLFLIISTIILSVLMVTELPLFALKFKGFKWEDNKIRYVFLTIGLILFATLLFWSIPIIIILYLILSLINNNTIHKKNEI
ncbi:MAG TPA: CDP-diacylglycerol--serine O-phosphatidyltransferase [Crocinitomix sp.]|nr:CDP-diacylglycerol--serine O-phosphatidyltransferase [Crocinitomix sp.]